MSVTVSAHASTRRARNASALFARVHLVKRTNYGAGLAHAQHGVSLEPAQQAAAWCDYLESHARRVYSCVVSPHMRAARELAEKIQQRTLGTAFTCRDVYLKGWSGLDTPDVVKLATAVLVDAAWIRGVHGDPGPAGGRPTDRFAVNPRVWA